MLANISRKKKIKFFFKIEFYPSHKLLTTSKFRWTPFIIQNLNCPERYSNKEKKNLNEHFSILKSERTEY